jgi:hypothetical protein
MPIVKVSNPTPSIPPVIKIAKKIFKTKIK